MFLNRDVWTILGVENFQITFLGGVRDCITCFPKLKILALGSNHAIWTVTEGKIREFNCLYLLTCTILNCNIIIITQIPTSTKSTKKVNV